MYTNTDHFTLLALHVQDNNWQVQISLATDKIVHMQVAHARSHLAWLTFAVTEGFSKESFAWTTILPKNGYN